MTQSRSKVKEMQMHELIGVPKYLLNFLMLKTCIKRSPSSSTITAIKISVPLLRNKHVLFIVCVGPNHNNPQYVGNPSISKNQ